MLRISVHLDRTILVALHQHRHRARHKRVRGSKIIWLAEDQVFGLLHIGINRLVRLLGASRQPGQRHRRTHQLHEAASRNWIHPLLRGRGKLPLHCCFELRRPSQLIDRPPVPLSVYALQLVAYSRQRHRLFSRTGARAARPAAPVLLLTHDLLFPVQTRKSLQLALAHRWQTSQLVNSRGVRIL